MTVNPEEKCKFCGSPVTCRSSLELVPEKPGGPRDVCCYTCFIRERPVRIKAITKGDVQAIEMTTRLFGKPFGYQDLSDEDLGRIAELLLGLVRTTIDALPEGIEHASSFATTAETN